MTLTEILLILILIAIESPYVINFISAQYETPTKATDDDKDPENPQPPESRAAPLPPPGPIDDIRDACSKFHLIDYYLQNLSRTASTDPDRVKKDIEYIRAQVSIFRAQFAEKYRLRSITNH